MGRSMYVVFVFSRGADVTMHVNILAEYGYVM